MQSTKQSTDDIHAYIKFLNKEFKELFYIPNPLQGMEIITHALIKASKCVEEFRSFCEKYHTTSNISQYEFNTELDKFRRDSKLTGPLELYKQIFINYKKLFDDYHKKEVERLEDAIDNAEWEWINYWDNIRDGIEDGDTDENKSLKRKIEECKKEDEDYWVAYSKIIGSVLDESKKIRDEL
jgi:hypothetical protein